jgi:hypothetical protein
VAVGEAWSFLAEPGIAVRGFTVDDGVAFSAQAREKTSVRIEASGFQPAPGAALLINGQPAAFTVEGGALRFTLPAGAVEVWLTPCSGG